MVHDDSLPGMGSHCNWQQETCFDRNSFEPLQEIYYPKWYCCCISALIGEYQRMKHCLDPQKYCITNVFWSIKIVPWNTFIASPPKKIQARRCKTSLSTPTRRLEKTALVYIIKMFIAFLPSLGEQNQRNLTVSCAPAEIAADYTLSQIRMKSILKTLGRWGFTDGGGVWHIWKTCGWLWLKLTARLL